jgi:hypothetical protein
MVCTESGCVKSLEVSHQVIRTDGKGRRETRTRMLSLSDRQGSKLTVSGLLGARTVKRDLPPNMREIGGSTDLAYSNPCIHRQRQLVQRENE